MKIALSRYWIRALYNTKDFATPPKAIDCLIVVKCASGTFELTLVELRDVSATKGVRPRDIIEKFKTTFTRFLAVDFVDVFGNPDHEVSDIRAWLVSDPFKASALSEEQYQRRIRGTVLDVFQSTKPFEFRQHRVMIRPLRPFPRPVVCTCPAPSATEMSDQGVELPQDRRPGSAKGRLRIVTEDDAQLADFRDHML